MYWKQVENHFFGKVNDLLIRDCNLFQKESFQPNNMDSLYGDFLKSKPSCSLAQSIAIIASLGFVYKNEYIFVILNKML